MSKNSNLDKIVNNKSLFLLRFNQCLTEDIKFNGLSVDEITKIMDEFLETEFSVNDRKYIQYFDEEEGGETILLFLPFDKAKKFIGISEELGILKSFEEVGDSVLKGELVREKFDKLKPLVLLECGIMSKKSKEIFIETWDGFIKENSNIDFVLDKINISGVESLSKVEMDILKNI